MTNDKNYNLGMVNWDQVSPTVASTANPAAGADPPDITVPAGKRWLLLGWAASLVTDGNAANRTIVTLVTADGTNELTRVRSTTNQTATQTRYYRWDSFKTYGESFVTDTYLLGFGRARGLELGPGATVETTTVNIQVGDDWTAVTYVYKELPA